MLEELELPAGDYWVLVPWSNQVPGLPGASGRGANLPDSSPVLAWRPATVPAAGTVAVTLTIEISLP